MPSAFAARCEQPALVEAACGQAVLAAAPPLVLVEVALPPMADLLAQQALPVAPAFADVEVDPPPIAVLLAQQALLAAAPEQVGWTAVVAVLPLQVGACADAWPANINPPIIRPQIIIIFEIIFIFFVSIE